MQSLLPMGWDTEAEESFMFLPGGSSLIRFFIFFFLPMTEL